MKKENKNRINYLKEKEQESQFNQSINTITKEDNTSPQFGHLCISPS